MRTVSAEIERRLVEVPEFGQAQREHPEAHVTSGYPCCQLAGEQGCVRAGGEDSCVPIRRKRGQSTLPIVDLLDLLYSDRSRHSLSGLGLDVVYQVTSSADRVEVEGFFVDIDRRSCTRPAGCRPSGVGPV